MDFTTSAPHLLLICLVLLTGCQRPPLHKTRTHTQPLASQVGAEQTPSNQRGELRYGMTKDQVLYKLGLPHIDPYAPDVWVYLVLTATQDKSFKIVFQNDRIHTIERIYS